MLEGAREPERIRRRVAPVQVERHLGSARDRLHGRFGERDLSLQLRGRDRARVQILVRQQRQVEVELQRREAAVGHLARTRRVGVGRVDVLRLSRRPVHLRVEVVELVRRGPHPRQPPRDERRAVARQRLARVAVRVDADPLAEAAAEELPERNLERARRQIPERRLDPRDRVVHGAAARHVRGREMELAHERLDLARVLAFEERRELADRLRQPRRAERLAPAARPSSLSTRTIVQS